MTGLEWPGLELSLALFLLANLVAALMAAERGPTAADRMLTALLFGSTGVGVLVLLAVASPWGWRPDSLDEFAPAKAAFSWTIFVLASVLAGWLPLRLGLRKVAVTEL
mgnify:CR=1 FL=1